MSEALNHHVSIAMERAVPRLLALLADICAMLHIIGGRAPSYFTRQARVKALRLLRPAEALMRRLIVLMADEIEVEGQKTRSSRRRPAPHGEPVEPGGQSGSGTPTFQLFEHIPSLASVFGAPTPEKFGPSLPPPELIEPDALMRRINALAGAIEHRDTLARAHARRLARWPKNVRLPRWDPCRPGRPPGLRSRHVPPWLVDMVQLFMMKIRRLPLPGAPPDQALHTV
ncbi:MAG: hypothetical protein WA989_06610 [Henriciella sp.]|uniref:hypothetical protein n=1 Tax=Henriciella sp. TaxID=1968823 RepID=UPI003C73DE3E